jgi:hypothetical protein
MKMILKIGKLLAILLLTVSLILLAASFLLKDKVGFIILKSINKNLSTKLEVGSYKLSFFRRFPKASLELKDVLVHSSHTFKASEFQETSTDTLLSARLVIVEFRITDIISGVYNIEGITARNGKANFFTDNSGDVNYNISVKNDEPGNEETVINLNRINLTDIYAYYNHLGSHLKVGGTVKTGKLKIRIIGDVIDFTGGTELRINRFDLYNFKMDKTVPAKIDLTLQSSKTGINFRKGVMHIDNSDINFTGTLGSDDFLDLSVKGTDLDIALIRKYMPEKYLSGIIDYDPSGAFVFNSKIKGEMSRKSNPHVDVTWQLKKGKIAYKKSGITIRDLSFSGNLSNGKGNKYETSTVSITDFKAGLGSTTYTGQGSLRNFDKPLIDMNLKGKVYPRELKEFFNIQSISAADGTADVDLKIVNGQWAAKNFSADGFIDLKPEGSVIFNSLTIGFQNNKVLFSDVTGSLTLLKYIQANKVNLKYKGQIIKINGHFYNLPEWLAGRHVVMTAKADISFNKLIPEAFLTGGTVAAESYRKKQAFRMPGDVKLDINFRIDSLTYKTFSSSQVEGSLNYVPRTLTYRSLKMKSLNGIITGNGFFAQNKDKSLMVKGSYDVKDIDVNQAFTTFHNFGQSFLKAENIKGVLSGSLSLLFPLDSLLNFHIKNLTAEGKYLLVNGALINFDPVKQLSTFIEISELENIKFDKLENDFFIRNNQLFIPQMEVKSSAADLSVNGKHSFENDYEYHVKILLSEILSRNRRKKSNITEFGVVEDDGLGRTSLLLKIVGKGEEAKVSYDMKAAGDHVKNSIKKEKQTLKTILNQEYGWYKGDSALNQKQPEQKKPSRFKIKWDDGEAKKP